MFWGFSFKKKKRAENDVNKYFRNELMSGRAKEVDIKRSVGSASIKVSQVVTVARVANHHHPPRFESFSGFAERVRTLLKNACNFRLECTSNLRWR